MPAFPFSTIRKKIKKRRWVKIMIKSCEIITGIFWNTVLLPILSHCPTQPTLISISASFQTSPFYPRPLNPLLSHSFLFFALFFPFLRFSLPSFLPSHLFLPLHLCLFSHYSFLKITHLVSFFLHICICFLISIPILPPTSYSVGDDD